MDSQIEIKQEDPLSDDIDSQNETELFYEVVTMKRNSDDCDMAIKTEIKSETSFPQYFVKQFKCETVTCSNNWEINKKTENTEQTLVSDFGSQNKDEFVPEDPVMKDNHDSEHEMDSKIQIKVEPWLLQSETSSICDDVKDGDFPPVKSSRLCAEAASGTSSGKLLPFEISGTDTSFLSGKDHFECERQKSDITEMPTTEEYAPSEQSDKYIDGGEAHVRPLYSNKKGLIHKDQRSYKCHICAKGFSCPSHLKTHNLIHEAKKPHHCKICDKSFTQFSNLKAHCLIHEGKKPYQCKTCDKNFSRMSHLKTHNLIHAGKKKQQCKICDKSFTLLSTLKRHNLIHEGKKPHQCKTCNKNFSRLSTLKRHGLIHEGKKPHQCKTCEKRFSDLSNLKKHNLIHEGKKPHQCKTCEKTFSDLSNLKTHNLIHEGKKPHQCKTCEKSFSHLSNLKKHNLIHEGKKPH